MAKRTHLQLARRERQIMDVVYRLGQASVSDVLSNVENPPSYSAVRAMMRLLEQKGHLKHKRQGARYVYLPTKARDQASQLALKNLVGTYFDGSASLAAAELIELTYKDLSPADRTVVAAAAEGFLKRRR
jgi:predicted transcriptional regulator